MGWNCEIIESILAQENSGRYINVMCWKLTKTYSACSKIDIFKYYLSIIVGNTHLVAFEKKDLPIVNWVRWFQIKSKFSSECCRFYAISYLTLIFKYSSLFETAVSTTIKSFIWNFKVCKSHVCTFLLRKKTQKGMKVIFVYLLRQKKK